jgi:hypothetical protein
MNKRIAIANPAQAFQRFKKTMKDLLSVSRKELQQEMDKYKREKSKKRR